MQMKKNFDLVEWLDGGERSESVRLLQDMSKSDDSSEFSTVLTDELEAMWRFALRLTGNETDAEDLVQRTCVKALENKHQYTESGQLRSWLFRIEHRIWLNVLRSRQIRSAGSFNTVSSSGENNAAETFNSDSNADSTNTRTQAATDQSPESQLELHQIYMQVESLPEAQRLVTTLVSVEGFTYQETADILDIPVGTVMSRLARARITLGKAILAANKPQAKTTADVGLPS